MNSRRNPGEKWRMVKALCEDQLRMHTANGDGREMTGRLESILVECVSALQQHREPTADVQEAARRLCASLSGCGACGGANNDHSDCIEPELSGFAQSQIDAKLRKVLAEVERYRTGLSVAISIIKRHLEGASDDRCGRCDGPGPTRDPRPHWRGFKSICGQCWGRNREEGEPQWSELAMSS